MKEVMGEAMVKGNLRWPWRCNLQAASSLVLVNWELWKTGHRTKEGEDKDQDDRF